MPFSRYPSGSCPCQVSLPFELRHFPAGSLSPLSRIEFVSYRLVVLLRLLPTPPHDDAVAVEYGPENVCPVGTFTLLFKCAYERTGRTLRGPNKATAEAGTPVTARRRGSLRKPVRLGISSTFHELSTFNFQPSTFNLQLSTFNFQPGPGSVSVKMIIDDGKQ